MDYISIRQLIPFGVNGMVLIAFFIHMRFNYRLYKQQLETHKESQREYFEILKNSLSQNAQFYVDMATRLTAIETMIDKQMYCPIIKEQHQELSKKNYTRG